MNNLFYTVFLLTAVYSASYFRLSTGPLQPTTLSAEQSIISTLGLVKATLKSSRCSLLIQSFNNITNKYETKGSYQSPNITGDCSKLIIKDGRLETDTGNQYITVNNIAYNYSTVFTIDDEGVIRLIGTYIQQNRVDIVSKQTVVDQFKQPRKYVRSVSQLVVQFVDRFEPFQNQRKWKFISQFGQLTVYYGENPGIKFDFVFSALTIRDSRIYDFDNQTFPRTLYTNLTFQPRCSEPKLFLDFKAPYTFVADPYWPIVYVYQQGGYKVITLAYSQLPQYDYNQNITQVNYYAFYSPCPPRTFEYRGDCINYCPPPYYHMIKGETGFCVLKCQQFSSVDEENRICNCVTNYEYPKLSTAKLVKKCQVGSIQTPYGCQCTQSGQYYDRTFTFSCVSTCPNSTVGINGVCMQCPYNCITCQRDGFNRQFLECKACKTGYNLHQGQCVQTCVTNYGYSLINQLCIKCKDPRCINCQTDVNFCLQCDLLYSLKNGSCVDSCLAEERAVYADYFSTSCMPANDPYCISYLKSHYRNIPYTKCDQCFPGFFAHLDKCVEKCPDGYRQHNDYCVCSGAANLTVHNQCLNQSACPIGTSFDIRSHSCLSCPFGCVSCVNRQCLACNPGYFLYVSPQNILCRRKSPLFPCDGQYSWQRNTTCMPTNYTDPLIQMTLCYMKIPNCQICFPGSNEICIVCEVGYQIYNNTCITKCPPQLIPFDNSCILPQIVNCTTPHLRSSSKQFIINVTSMDASQSYGYYIYNKEEFLNDPISYMPYFQNLTLFKSDNIPRQSNFFTPEWICLKCNDGYGLSDDFKQCLPCPVQCLENRCYMAKKYSCLTTKNQSNCKIDEYIDDQTGACLKSCNSSQKYPQIKEGRLYCVSSSKSSTKNFMKVDSSVFSMKDGTQHVFFAFSEPVNTLNNPKVQMQSFAPKSFKVGDVLEDNTTIVKPSTNNFPIPKNVAAVTPSLTPLSQTSVSSPIYTLPIVNGQYVELGQQPFNAYLLNLSQSLLNLTGANDPVVFPSKLYGAVYLADHTVFMTTWLAYIGYIMSIVIIILHAVFIGNQLLYKVDNLLIFIQTIFYFSYVKNLVGRLLAQFYFGWSFSHARFLPNLFSPTIPDHYVERPAPVSYKLMNIDGNYFRNAGFSLVWMLIYVASCLFIIFVVWSLIFKLCRKIQTWYPRVARQALAAGFEFFSMNLMFFSVSQLAYSYGANQGGFQDYYDRSRILAIITLVVIGVYTLLRLIFNPIGGLYMLKRCLIASILVFAYSLPLLIIPLIALEILFSIFRHVIQSPIVRFQKVTIWIQALLIIGCYFLLFFCVDAGVNTIIISIFVFIFLVYLAYDLTTIYLESRNQFPEQKLAKEYDQLATQLHRERANTVNYGNNATGYKNPSRGGSILMMDRE